MLHAKHNNNNERRKKYTNQNILYIKNCEQKKNYKNSEKSKHPLIVEKQQPQHRI